LGGAAALLVIEGYKAELALRERRLEQREDRCLRETMLRAEMKNRADEATPAAFVLILALHPMVIVGKKIEQEIQELYGLAGFG
jgi:hypothetical protein